MPEQTTSAMANNYRTGTAVRLAARDKALTGQTSGLAPSCLQANLLVLPSRYAADFRLLCARNPVPCPLLAESAAPGDAKTLISHVAAPHNHHHQGAAAATLPVATDIDLRHDFPAYTVYKDGVQTTHHQPDIAAEWTPDHVGFLIGCSYSFEAALANAGLTPRHVAQGRNVSMYRTTVPLMAAGVFAGPTVTMVVSMRPYRAGREVDRVREITRAFASTHGEPVAWGWEGAAALGIGDIARPEFGDAPLRADGSGLPFGPGEWGAADKEEEEEGGEFVPVFWGCGVTPQEAVRQAGLEGTVMAHAPGHMVVLDLTDREVFPGAVGVSH